MDFTLRSEGSDPNLAGGSAFEMCAGREIQVGPEIEKEIT